MQLPSGPPAHEVACVASFPAEGTVIYVSPSLVQASFLPRSAQGHLRAQQTCLLL